MEETSLLLELGVPFKLGNHGLLVEAQALNGMRLWAKHFDRVTVCAPQLPEGYVDSSSVVWEEPGDLLADGRVTFEPLPWGYHPREHFKHRAKVLHRFDALVASHRYLCFSNLGAFGAWGGLGVKAAQKRLRSYSLWFDWILHEMPSGQHGSLKDKMRRKIYRFVTKRVTYNAVRNCDLGLFHGKTVYDAYAPMCRAPALVHDVHVHPDDAISESDLEARLISLSSRSLIRIGYVGRAHPMKAPMQWIDAVAKAVSKLGSGRIEATWLGDGPLLDEARAYIQRLGLQDCIRFEGFVESRHQVLSFLRTRDLMLFTHITPESPRALIEALISGLPLVGYQSSYASELVEGRGGAVLSPIGNTDALASNLVALIKDCEKLRQLTRSAATARPIYNDQAVFAHRSELIKRFL